MSFESLPPKHMLLLVVCLGNMHFLLRMRFMSSPLVHRPQILINFGKKIISSHKLSSISKRNQEKKVERLKTLHDAITDIYSSTNGQKSDFDWLEAREKLIEREIHFPTNFEFALISAFDPTLNPNQAELDKNLFESIASFVSQSQTVQSNKIAATRFCVFLSQYPQYLNEDHLNFIRQTAELVANDSVQIHPVIIDIVQSLARSSKSNCVLALQLLPKFLQCRDQSFSLKLDLLNILFAAIIQHQLQKECYQFLKEYAHLLKVDLDIVRKYIQLIGSFRITKQFTRYNLLEMLQFLGEMYTPIAADGVIILVDKILKQKIGYQIMYNARIDSTKSQCDCCGSILTGLSHEEFLQLKSNFKSIIFDRNDQYLIENLNEYHVQLMEFEEHILINEGEQPKYDLVVDGLNVSYRRSKTVINDKTGLRQFAKIYKVKDLDNQITTIIESNNLLHKFKRLLLIGRNHMKTWFQLRRMCQKNKDKIDLNLLLDGTRDDNYILYAAVQHPSIMILSSDFFRDHRQKFYDWYRNETTDSTCSEERPNLERLFQRWLKSRQIKVENKSIGSTNLRYPSPFDIKIHFHYTHDHPNPIIHIPVVVKQDPFNEDHEIGWICAQPDNKI